MKKRRKCANNNDGELVVVSVMVMMKKAKIECIVWIFLTTLIIIVHYTAWTIYVLSNYVY